MNKKLLLLAIFSVSFSSYAQLLNCRTNSSNPSYELTIERDNLSSRFYGSLTRRTIGFVATGKEAKQLGRDPLALKLNPSTCEVRITSLNNSKSEFSILLPLNDIGVRTGYAAGNKEFSGAMSGSLFGSYDLTCSRHDSDLIRSLQEVCIKDSSLHSEVVFTKASAIIDFLNSGADSVSTGSVRKESYPQEYSPTRFSSATPQ